ncbi:MAG: cytochrome b/b6 domain-containing protein [Pseudomonadota bacterium]
MYSDSYALIQRLLHWTIALVVLALLAVGALLGNVGFQGLVEAVGQDMTNQLYKYHKTFGVILLGLMLARVVCRLMLGSPAYSEPLPLFNRLASGAVHVALYAALLSMPILGWLATAAGGFPVEFFNMKLPGLIGKDPELAKLLFQWHGIMGWVILGLAAVHIGAAIHHWTQPRDRVMGRMSLL